MTRKHRNTKPIHIPILRFALLAVALSAIFYGAVSGGIEAVITKAVAICMECVGLG